MATLLQITKACKSYGDQVLLDSAEATRALNALENSYDYVLFVAENELTPWSEKVIRQADLVLAVGRHGSDATPNALERLAADLLPADARRLVLRVNSWSSFSGSRPRALP